MSMCRVNDCERSSGTCVIECRDCERQYQSDERECPHCGLRTCTQVDVVGCAIAPGQGDISKKVIATAGERIGVGDLVVIDYIEACMEDGTGRISAYSGDTFVTYLYPEDLPELSKNWQFASGRLALARQLLKRSRSSNGVKSPNEPA